MERASAVKRLLCMSDKDPPTTAEEMLKRARYVRFRALASSNKKVAARLMALAAELEARAAKISAAKGGWLSDEMK
jgi:hypothetical protein